MDGKTLYAKCKIIIIGAGIGGLTAGIALRRAGHEVHVFESLSSESESGEIIHIWPNANSALRHIDVDREVRGGNTIGNVQYYTVGGARLGSIDMKEETHCWQSPWLVCRRGDFVKYLEEAACSEMLPDPAVIIHRDLRAVVVNTERNTVRFDNDEIINADLIISADGFNSIARSPMNEKPNTMSDFQLRPDITPRTSFKSHQENSTLPFEFSNSDVKIFATEDCGVIVTTVDASPSITIVCHNAQTYQDYKQASSIQKIQGLDSLLKDTVQKTRGEDITVTSTIEADVVPAWTENRLAFIGDAACHFPPHFLCGTSIEIEDGVSLGVLLSGMDTKEDIPERLSIFNETRRKRVIQLRDLSREAWSGLEKGYFSREVTDFAFSYDVVHHTTQLLRQHKWEQTPRINWRQPVGFGPMMSPRQHISRSTCSNPRPDRLAEARSLTASIRFRTSKTLLENLFPSDQYSFSKRGSIAEASFVFQSIENLAWLGGGGYNLVLFQIHDIQHRSTKTGTTRDGSYVAVVLEDLADPIISGREDLGWPKLFSDILVRDNTGTGGGLSVTLSWRGCKWLSLSWNSLQPYQQRSQPLQPSAEHVFVHKYIPATTEIPNRQGADADYDVLMPPASPASRPVQWRHAAAASAFEVESGLDQELPTLWHVADRLAELPNFGIVEAKIGTKEGQDDFSGAIRV